MKTLVSALITSLLVFILATGWIEVVQPQISWMAFSNGSKSRERFASNNTDHAEMTVQELEDADEVASATVSRKVSKVSRTAKQNRDETEKMKAKVALQLEEVKKQETKLVAREENLRMLYDDIRSELSAIEEIRRRSAAELAVAEQKILDVTKGNSNAYLTAADGGQRMMTGTKGNDKSTQSYIAGMVEDLANRGSIDTAAGLLRGMKDREIAKVLTSLSTRNPRLANQLFDQVQTARHETAIRR